MRCPFHPPASLATVVAGLLVLAFRAWGPYSAGFALAAFNPGLHLPEDRTPERLAALERRMREAESSHGILFVLTLALIVNAAARGHWIAAGWTLLFDVLVNGYPVMLQRYNRALLARRFGPF